jgi:hypothetical protein
VHDIRIRNVKDSAPSPQGILEQLVHVSDFRAAIEHPLQSLEAPALYAHLLGMRQRPIIPHRPQSERKTPAQMGMPGFDSSRPKTPIFHSTAPVFMRVSGRISGNSCNGTFGLLK